MPRGVTGISSLPISLQTLLEATEYPPETPSLLQVTTTKVVMIVENVSPTPFSLLRRAKNFEYSDNDWHLQEFADFDDPIQALTDECLRVLKCISTTNESTVSNSKHSTSLRDASWSRFEDIGFGGSIESDQEDEGAIAAAATQKSEAAGGMKSAPQSQGADFGRPTTPSWADFMSSGFADENNLKNPVGPLLLPPDKVLPRIVAARGQSSQSHKRHLDAEPSLEPAELASINTLDLDDSFWWVWITSLSGDEPSTRKAVFGRCALLETVIRNTKWLVLEEQVKGAAPEPEAGAQIVEKKRFFSFGSRKGAKLSRRKSSAKKVSSIEESYKRTGNQAGQSKTSIGPDQHKRIQAAAAALQKRHREQEAQAANDRGYTGDDSRSTKTNSVLTLQPAIVNEASSAMKWANNYDKHSLRAAYLSNNRAGTGIHAEHAAAPPAEKPTTPAPVSPAATTSKNPPPPPPKDAVATPLPPSPEPPAKPPKDDVPSRPPPQDDKQKPATKTVVIEPPSEPSSQELVEETNKKLKKKSGNAGFKNMFTTNKKKSDQPPIRTTGVSSSVAAARAALEAKAKESQDSVPKSSKPSVLKKKPVPGMKAEPPAPAPAPAPAPVVAAEPEKPSTPQKTEEPVAEPVTEPVAEAEAIAQPAASATDANAGGPPTTRHAVEYDALSRVDTNERDAADQEFSKFDQGPLVEQPAFIPAESPQLSPVAAQVPVAKPEPPKTPTNGQDDEPAAVPGAEGEDSPEDRWAQIRKNAAERIGATEEPETRTSQSERTDEGDTSGEETIESRVARIKARVAELTGNMETNQ